MKFEMAATDASQSRNTQARRQTAPGSISRPAPFAARLEVEPWMSIVGYLGMAGAFVAPFATGNAFSSAPLVIAVQLGAFLLMVWARRTFGRRSFHAAANPTEGGLITSGPYRYIRHPIYTAVCMFSVAGAVAHWSWASLLLSGLLVGGALVRIFSEEVLVTARYPEYRRYAATTWRMIPYVF
jgi:protein-S-isoprenylcysteine O-methyltransferase Ste14